MATLFLGQRLDQTGLLQGGQTPVQRPRPELRPRELSDVLDEGVPVFGSPGEAGKIRTLFSASRAERIRESSFP